MFGLRWPLEHYGVVARHLGRFNGAYLVDQPLPGWSWLSSNWLRHYIEQSAPVIEPLRDALALPWARRWLPEVDSDQFFRVWAERELYLDALDRLPQTICHFDIFRRNLFARKTVDGDDQTVFEGYLEGLREAGWQGDPQQVRLGYTAAGARYMFPELGRWLALILDESLRAEMEQRSGFPIGETFDLVARMRRPEFSKLDQARELIGILG